MIEDLYDIFILAYDSPTFSAAAAKVPMTSQGFTKIIKKLERDLGVPLFQTDENGKRRPTNYADEYYQYAKKIQVARRRLDAEFEKIKQEETVDLRIACSIGIPGLFGVEVVSGETYEHSHVNIISTEVPDIQCDLLVESGISDAGITIDPVGEGLDSVELVSFPMLILVNRDDPLSNKDSLTLEDISERKLAMPGKEFHIYSNLMKVFADNEIPIPTIVEYAEIFWIYDFVATKKGLGFSLPHIASLNFFSSQDVVAIPLSGMEWRVVFVYQHGRELTPYMLDYLAEIKRVAKKVQIACE